ncbi:SAM-dependent methyltransferase [Paenibacillus agilis]|uniref:SAM-dependent methyltransferase n=1 Tax=Paenibacillus agilis TaxID=3020863 RepID=A0A559IZR4_9BACL|nr:SAM-dependent methyltransferase [Paenibacillus agilis]TVX93097.1 SAM-dependent methyltransferase [Paenibacillus agilis]
MSVISNEIHPTRNYELGSHWIVTANHGYIPYAQEELRRKYNYLKSTILVSGEVAFMELPESEGAVWDLLRREPAIFIRDAYPVHIILPVDAVSSEEDAEQLWGELLERSGLSLEGKSSGAVHVRTSPKKVKTEDASDKEAVFQWRSAIQLVWSKQNITAAVQQPDFILTLFEHEQQVYVGLAAFADQQSDWPGGAIRFRREDGQISRAKFKLLEAEQVFGLDFSAYRNGLDVGAAPGGWSSLLLERGIHVTAVDPAKMHPSLMDHPNFTYYGRNAAEVVFEPNEFDLIVCDMSWSPKHTAQLVIQLLDSLVYGGTLIVTVKLMHKKPLQTIRDCMEMFEKHATIVRAKQLFHNRDEITLYMLKN